MKRTLLSAFIVLLPLHASCQGPSVPSRYWVTAYYTSWSPGRLNPADVSWRGITHLVHHYISPQADPPYLKVLNRTLPDSANFLHGADRGLTGWNIPDSLRKYGDIYHVALLLDLGTTWDSPEAKYLGRIASDSNTCKTFVDNLLGFARRHHYDGIEVDWEPPGSRDQMARLLRFLRRGLDQWHPRGVLTVSVPPFSAGSLDASLASVVDQLNLMMYDYTQNNDNVTGFNAPIYSPDKNAYPSLWRWQDSWNGVWNAPGYYPKVQNGPRKFIEAGWPASKLGAGLPLYGYLYVGKTAPNQSQQGSFRRMANFHFALEAANNGGVFHWDDAARVPWIGGTALKAFGDDWWNGNVQAGEAFYLTFDDERSLREKVMYGKGLGLGGFLLYELGTQYIPSAPQGQRHPLVKAVVDEVYK